MSIVTLPPPSTGHASPTIGVFDSGFGGLTVLKALLPLISGARYLYLGDTARLPYGSKSRETIVRYAVSSARFLFEQGAERLVIACNTASALALDAIQVALPIPVTGVIDPGAAGAAAYMTLARQHGERPTNQVLVLATAATVQSGAYTRALQQYGLSATEKACPLLVPLVEEGWLDATPGTTAVTANILRIYLEEARHDAPAASSMLLACTHYPLLTPLIEKVLADLGYPLHIVDAAQTTARLVADSYPRPNHFRPAQATFFATDSVEKFQQLGSRFLGRDLGRVDLIDLGG